MPVGECQAEFRVAAAVDGVELTGQKPPWLTRRGHLDLPAGPGREALAAIFVALGGDLDALAGKTPTPIRGDFLHEPTDTLVEVDEYQHFTSFRLLTLEMYPGREPASAAAPADTAAVAGEPSAAGFGCVGVLLVFGLAYALAAVIGRHGPASWFATALALAATWVVLRASVGVGDARSAPSRARWMAGREADGLRPRSLEYLRWCLSAHLGSGAGSMQWS